RVDGTDARELWSARSALPVNPRWSPDSKQLALIRSTSQNTASAVVVLDAARGTAREFPSPHLASLSNACWDGTGNGLLVAEGENLVAIQAGGQGQLIRLDLRR